MSGQFGKDIKHRVFIAAPPEKVFYTITSGDDWNTFFTHATEIDPRPDGRMWFRWKDWGQDFYSAETECRVVKAERPNSFAFEWYPVGKVISRRWNWRWRGNTAARLLH
ncbi:MAG: SRPBCC domain-containing protein [Candidatus Zixiibacteriota bacterium]|nr:MAG: SRPBCC domain-containing protein [candidate division Zixibacteria bacterium]